jgi:hypothetical protein
MAVFLVGIILVICYQLLTGRINTRKMLFDKNTGAMSPGRIQLLVLTLAGAVYFAIRLNAVDHATGIMPRIPKVLVLLAVGSHATYLGGKASLLKLVSPLFRRHGAE